MANVDVLKNTRGKWVNRVMIGTPTTGTIRMEWVNGRYGQTIPTNWSHVDTQQWMSSNIPLGYQVADAENLIAKAVIENNFEWLLSYEHDNIPPPDSFVKINEYMIKADIPVVAGLYFTKSVPPEPMIYRGKGRGYYADWKLGDKVWAQGVPFGFTLIHSSLLKVLWDESPEYNCYGTITRRVFHTPSDSWADPDTGGWLATSGTSDLQWCERLVTDRIFEKAGWPEFQKKENPFLVDTSIFVKHIDGQGVLYPIGLPKQFLQGKITYQQALRMLTGPESEPLKRH